METVVEKNESGKEKGVSFYRLKVNINGFRIEDVKVSVEEVKSASNSNNKDKDKENANNNSGKVRVKIAAVRNVKSDSQDTTKEYVKYHDIFKSKSQIDTTTMRYYMDEKNVSFLIVEFESNLNENVYVNLDDSCESLVELAARSLLNIKNLDNLKNMIQDPFNNTLDANLDEIFSPTLIKDLNLATKTNFTPIKVESDRFGNKKIRLDVAIPNSMEPKKLTLNVLTDKKHQEAKKTPVDKAPVDDSYAINLRLDGLKLNFEAVTSSGDTTSSFSKQFSLPKGTQVDKISYLIDENKHCLVVEAPISII